MKKEFKTTHGTVIMTGDKVKCNIRGRAIPEGYFICKGDAKGLVEYNVILHNVEGSACRNFDNSLTVDTGVPETDYKYGFGFYEGFSAEHVTNLELLTPRVKESKEMKPETSLYEDLANLFK